jgi:hypothetical protein
VSSSSSSRRVSRACIIPIALTRNGLTSVNSSGVRLVTYAHTSQLEPSMKQDEADSPGDSSPASRPHSADPT